MSGPGGAQITAMIATRSTQAWLSPAPGTPPRGTFTFITFEPEGPGYQLNVKTTGYPPGSYTLSFTAGADPTVHTAKFAIS